MSVGMMKNMSPDQLKNMTEMAKKMYPNGKLPTNMGGGGFPAQRPASYSPPTQDDKYIEYKTDYVKN